MQGRMQVLRLFRQSQKPESVLNDDGADNIKDRRGKKRDHRSSHSRSA